VGENQFAALVELLADPLFDPRRDVVADELDELTYRQLDHLNRSVDSAVPLVLGDQKLLRNLTELTAMVSPSLFMAFFLHHSMAVGAVVDYGARSQSWAEFAPGAFGSILMTEFGYGSSSADILTEARYDATSGEFVLSTPCGEAVKFPSNVGASVPRWGVVSARLKVDGRDHGVFLFRVPLRDAEGPCPGVHIRPVPAFPQLQLDYAATRFDEVRVPWSGWLSDGAEITGDGGFRDPCDGPAERTRRTVGVSRFAHGSNALGLAAVARASVAIAAPYLRRRHANNRFGGRAPLIAYRNQQSLLVKAVAAAFAATAVARMTADVCWRMRSVRGRAPVSAGELRSASLAKVAVSRLAAVATAGAQEACGAAGFMAMNRISEYRAFAIAFHNAGGDNQMYLLNAAWSMADGVDYEPPYTPDMAKYAGSDVLERCLALVRQREHDLCLEMRAARDDATARGAAGLVVWNEVSDVALRFAEAAVARMTVERMCEYALDGQLEPVRDLLLAMCEVTLVTEVLAHDGWYLLREAVTPSLLSELTRASTRLHDRLLGELPMLTRMLEIPMEILRCPLAGDHYPGYIEPMISVEHR
jgi:acyl-CoA oxidase